MNIKFEEEEEDTDMQKKYYLIDDVNIDAEIENKIVYEIFSLMQDSLEKIFNPPERLKNIVRQDHQEPHSGSNINNILWELDKVRFFNTFANIAKCCSACFPRCC